MKVVDKLEYDAAVENNRQLPEWKVLGVFRKPTSKMQGGYLTFATSKKNVSFRFLQAGELAKGSTPSNVSQCFCVSVSVCVCVCACVIEV